MTTTPLTHTRRTPARVTPYTIERRVAGTPSEVAATVALIRDSGRLVAMTPPQQIPNDGRVWVNVRFITPHPVTTRPAAARRQTCPARRTRVTHRAVVAAAVAVPVTGAVAGAVTAAGYAVIHLAHAVAAAWPVLLGAVTVLAVIWLLLARAGVCCPGLHCPGCNH